MVRKGSLRLFQQLIAIFGLHIFNVDLDAGKTFLQKEQVIHENKEAKINYAKIYEEKVKLDKTLDELMKRKGEGIDCDEEELKILLQQDPEYKEASKQLKDISDQHEQAYYIMDVY